MLEYGYITEQDVRHFEAMESSGAFDYQQDPNQDPITFDYTTHTTSEDYQHFGDIPFIPTITGHIEHARLEADSTDYSIDFSSNQQEEVNPESSFKSRDSTLIVNGPDMSLFRNESTSTTINESGHTTNIVNNNITVVPRTIFGGAKLKKLSSRKDPSLDDTINLLLSLKSPAIHRD